MTAQVYYRKWRPRRLDQVVGQQAVTHTLRQAIAQGRVAHAYLFAGPRGTGKTSTARILAKAVNCTRRQGGEPCDECSFCVAVNEGSLIDLIEIDAASNRGIEEIRNLREQVRFLPNEATYKVYIIDEAHMLTKEAFNAFLKTLEEPPAHAIFVLCTTELHKLAPTIVSRCQRFDFRRISLNEVVGRLGQVCREEGVEAEPEALRAIARLAWGSLRDAENILEQLVTSQGNRVTLGQVRDLLGLSPDERALALVKHTLNGNTPQALEVVNTVAAEGLDLRILLRQVVEHLRGVMLLKSGVRDTLEYPKDTLQEMSFLASRVALERLLKTVKVFGQVNMRYDSPSPLPLELAVVECALEDESKPSPDLQAARGRTPGGGSSRDAGATSPPPDSVAPPGGTSIPSPPVEASAGSQYGSGAVAPQQRGEPDPASADSPGEAPQEAASVPGNAHASNETPVGVGGGQAPAPDEAIARRLEEQWGSILKALSRFKGPRFNIGALLRDCRTRKVEESTVALFFSHSSHLERIQEEMEDPACHRDVLEVFRRHLGAACELRLEAAKEMSTPAQQGKARSPLVEAALGMGAKLAEEKGEEEYGQ